MHTFQSGPARREHRSRSLVSSLFGLGLAAAGAAMSGCTSPLSELNLPTDAKPTCTVASTEFASWFQSGSVSLNGVVNPADSVAFPNNPNCSFYQWSEHMYLWLTSPAPPTYGGGGGRIFASPAFYDISAPDSTGHRRLIGHAPGMLSAFALRAAQAGADRLPVVMRKGGGLFEVVPAKLGPHGKRMVLNAQGQATEVQQVRLDSKRLPHFLDLNGREIERPRPIIPEGLREKHLLAEFTLDGAHIFLDPLGNVVDVEQGQAGGNGVLEAQGGSLIYYASMVNDVYAYFLTGIKDGALPSPGGNPADAVFPTTQADLDAITAFASTHGKTFPDPKALAIEIKTSWIEASTLDHPENFITMQAKVPVYDRTDPHHWVHTGDTIKTLAMVGIHVVGSTAGHPEMIWATFEHKNNTPDASYQYVDASNTVKTVPQDNSGRWLFTAAGSSGPFNQERMRFNDPNIDAVSPFTNGPSDTLRWKAWGGAFDQRPNPIDADTAHSNTEIIAIDNSVRGQLAAGDIRGNYVMTGATWTIGGAAPSGAFPSGNEVGTSKLANTTMETYQQGSNALFATGTNCFSCHLSNQPVQATVAVSHMFPDIDPLF